jgi:hypothetical protein
MSDEAFPDTVESIEDVLQVLRYGHTNTSSEKYVRISHDLVSHMIVALETDLEMIRIAAKHLQDFR